jgi:metal-sulfur cluster biosynthetic enzyme
VLTSGWCPFVVPLLDTIRARLADLAAVDVRVVWDRAWSSDRMSQTARQRLQFLPPPNQISGSGADAALVVQPTPEVRP